MSIATTDRVTVTCPECGRDRRVSPKTALNIRAGQRSRCATCAKSGDRNPKRRGRQTATPEEANVTVLNAQARVGPLQIDAEMPDMADAACAGTDPSMWFTDKPQRPLDMEPRARWVEPKPVRMMRQRRMRQALAICRDCPALAQCREYTEQHPEMTAYGIWAASTGDQRRKARNAQRRRRKAVA